MNKINNLSAGLLASAMASIALTGPSFAANVDAHSQIHKADGITYACTGTGESKFDPRWTTFAADCIVFIPWAGPSRASRS